MLIASVHRGIEAVSTTLPHIRTNLPLSNFIQARLVTAEKCGVLRAEALDISAASPVMHRGGWIGARGKRSQHLEEGCPLSLERSVHPVETLFKGVNASDQ